jgi:hypothetical protein
VVHGSACSAGTEPSVGAEVSVAVHVLNRMLALGRPNYTPLTQGRGEAVLPGI